MNALLHRVHNFIFPLWKGEDLVCKCSCGSQQAYRVVPYEGARLRVDSRENFFGDNIMTQQNVDVLGGLLLGILITWFLLWLNSYWNLKLRFWMANQLNSIRRWARLPRLSTIVNALRQLHLKDTEDLEHEDSAQLQICTCSKDCDI